MAKISEMIESKYLRKEDVEDDTIVTIQGVKQANIAREDDPAEYKWLMKFREFEKPLVLNSTNIQLTALITGEEDSVDWKDKQVVLYVDPNVSYQGKLTGGLRIKALRKEKAAVTKSAAANSGDGWEDDAAPNNNVTADDIPF